MRKLIVAATAIAFLSSTAAFAQGTAPSTTAPAAGDTMSKGDASSGKMAKTTKKKTKKSAKAKTESGETAK